MTKLVCLRTPLTHQPLSLAPASSPSRPRQYPADQVPALLPGIELQLLFAPGVDSLTPRARASLLLLAELLRSYPRLLVRLEGHTDPRGTDEYNNVLSDYRARSAEQCLLDAGIEAARILRSACGASRSTAARGDQRAYTLERRVTVEIYSAPH